MKIQLLSVAVVVLVSTTGVSVAPAHGALKCPPQRVFPTVVRAPALPAHGSEAAGRVYSPPVYARSAPVYVLDGTIVERAAIDATDPETVASITVVCSDERHRVFGVEPERDLVLVFTNPGPRAALEASLESIIPLQAAYFDMHGVFASSLMELSWRDPSGLITVDLRVSDDGASWAASGTHRFLVDAEPLSVSGARPAKAGGGSR